MNQLDFFNTTAESGKELQKQVNKATHQNEIIYGIFKRYAGVEFTGSDIEKHTRYLICSVRRSITVMHGKGLIVRTGKRWNKDTKANEFTYKINLQG